MGAVAGMVTGLLHVKFKISNLLSGILVMIGLYSVNLRIMGRANVPLFHDTTVFYNSIPVLVMICFFAIVSKVILDIFFKTKSGFIKTLC